MRRILTTLTAVMFATCAMAEPVDERSARKMLFPAKGFNVEYVEGSGLTDTQLGYFKLLVKGRDSRSQFGRLAHYYGAIAISPSVFEGSPAALLSDPESVPFRLDTGLHSVAAAEAAALQGCAALVKRGQKPCVIAARILPKRYKPRDLTMSIFATDAFKAYRKADGPKAFAISPSTRAYGLADGDVAPQEAVEICNGKAKEVGKSDCVVVISDES